MLRFPAKLRSVLSMCADTIYSITKIIENVAINNALPRKAARRDAIADLKSSCTPGTPATQFRWFHLHSLCDATLFSWHQRHYVISFVEVRVPFADLRVRLLATKQNAEFTEGADIDGSWQRVALESVHGRH